MAKGLMRVVMGMVKWYCGVKVLRKSGSEKESEIRISYIGRVWGLRRRRR